jgi:hypothetical protein
VSRRVQYTRRGLRLPTDVQLSARHRPDDSGVDIAVLSPPPPRSRHCVFPTVERVDELVQARDVAALLSLRDDVREILSNGPLTADDAKVGGTVLAKIEQALLRLAGGKEAVTMADHPRGRQEGQERPLDVRVQEARRAIHGQRDSTLTGQGQEHAEEMRRALVPDRRYGEDVQDRVRQARSALGLET